MHNPSRAKEKRKKFEKKNKTTGMAVSVTLGKPT
jgi:hypothetical protein